MLQTHTFWLLLKRQLRMQSKAEYFIILVLRQYRQIQHHKWLGMRHEIERKKKTASLLRLLLYNLKALKTSMTSHFEMHKVNRWCKPMQRSYHMLTHLWAHRTHENTKEKFKNVLNLRTFGSSAVGVRWWGWRRTYQRGGDVWSCSSMTGFAFPPGAS